MSEKKQKVPKLRFPGFTGEWEQRKLCEVAEITMGQSPSSKNYTDNPEDFILVQGNADLKNGAVVPRLWTKEVTKTAEANSIILTVRAPVGEVAISGYDVVLGRGVAGIKGNDFLYYVLLCLKEFHYWEKLSSGSTFDSINSNDIKEILINMPDEKEQEVITSQLKNIDNLIILHLHKLENLKLKKKALLQKLFPKNGMQFPELRFPGFTDAWEQRKLEDMGETFTGLTGKTKEDFGHGEARYITYLNVFQNIMSDLTMVDSIEIDKTQNEVCYGDILFTTSSETPEEVGLTSVWLGTDDNTYLNSFCFGYRLSVEVDLYFMGYLLRSPSVREQMKILAQGISRYNISKNKVMEIEVYIPTKVEQTMIGQFLHQLDNSITLHQRKLEHLQLQKKALLQQMFV